MISGVDNTVVLTGRCTRVEVPESRIEVNIGEAAAIVVSGLNNEGQISFRRTGTQQNQGGVKTLRRRHELSTSWPCAGS